jgi:hypothetical protein
MKNVFLQHRIYKLIKRVLQFSASSYIAQADPSTNPNFKKINENTYVCDTTLGHPEACSSNTAQPTRVMYDATGGSIN